MAEEIFRKYYKRVAKEGVLKSFLIALCFGLGSLGVTAFFSWFFGFKAGLWIGIALFAAVTAGLTAALYFLKFRPTTKQIARRVDELGLEERVLTMTELEGDSSYIAMRQREDTLTTLKGVDHMLLKMVVSASLIAAVSACGLAGLALTTVDALYFADVIPSAMTSISETVGVKKYAFSYVAELSDSAVAAYQAAELPVPESGFGEVYYYDEETWSLSELFEGEIEVKEGEYAPAVIAMPAEGYVFLQWSDGSRDQFRKDIAQKNLALAAFFEPLPDLDVQDPQLQDPLTPQPQQGSGNGESNNEPQEGESGEGNSSGSEGAGGAPNSASNKYLDGETYYGHGFGEAYQEAQDRLNSDSSLTDEQKGWVNGYYESIERNEGGGNSEGEGGSGEETP